ncbi:hypothetical protein FY136_28900 (plasmid) [Agrobacterium tumefaciens]|uniref:hypothetical protein n=1 Tax=Agrobacterium tumefaciens TaxID=358 RepID=UPI0021D09248|nr:hypothetical protein [Agrobacterium tumefaciens]UXT53283.1 hypothetical protein FY136_28900 [Agrobacterium tumefaciens]
MSKNKNTSINSVAVDTKRAFASIRIEDGLAALDAYSKETPPSKAVKSGPSAFLADPRIAAKVKELRDAGYTAKQISEAFTSAGIPIKHGIVNGQKQTPIDEQRAEQPA